MSTSSRQAKRLYTHDWPFEIELIPLKDLVVDLRYQRPVQEHFVEKLIAEFDERLVGVIDVSAREDGTHAILDGSQRFHAMQKFKKTAWCAVYSGMSLPDEARHFYEINRNRRSVHPYYQHQALLVTGDKAAREIDRIVRSEGYKLGIGARQDDVISAVRAVEYAYDLSSLVRKESLSPTIHLIRNCFYGTKAGKEGDLIKGFARFFQPFGDDEIDWGDFYTKMAEYNPAALVARAREKSELGREATSYYLANNIVEIYNRGRKSGKRLFPSMIEKGK